MKKQTYWKAIRGENKSIQFEEAQGYVIDLTDQHGYTVKIALEYRRPYWYATHYESGLSCMPYRDIKEYPHRSNLYKSKEELISNIKEIDFEKCIKGSASFIQMLADFRSKN